MSSSFEHPGGAGAARRSGASNGPPAGAHWLFGRNRLDIDSHELVRDGYRIQLDERGFAVLACLLRQAEHVVPRAALVAEAWPGIAQVKDSAVSKTMRRLRIALGSDAARTLATVYGVGYRLSTPAILVPAGATLPDDTAADSRVAMAALPRQRPARAWQTPGHLPPAQPHPPPHPLPAHARPRPAHRHRVTVIVVVLVLCALLVAWLLLVPAAR